MVRAIETRGTVEEKRRLLLDESLPLNMQERVRVIILLEGDSEISEREWLEAAALNRSFEFLHDPEEDIYRATDGEPFGEQG